MTSNPKITKSPALLRRGSKIEGDPHDTRE
nr:MAG TPA: hypothetical protein [Caudoviricetes sp.]